MDEHAERLQFIVIKAQETGIQLGTNIQEQSLLKHIEKNQGL